MASNEKGRPVAPEKKKPTSAALKAAVAQLEEEEQGKKKNTALLRVGAVVLWALAALAMYCPQIGQMNLPFGACRMLMLHAVTECVADIVAAGVLVVLAVAAVEAMMPLLMAFAAGAMMLVVFEEMIPAAAGERLGMLCAMAGYVLMMALDLALG